MPFPVETRFVKAAEAKLGVTFPLGYVARLVRANGGETRAARDIWQLHPVLDTTDKARLKRTCNDVVRETRQAREWPDFPPDAVAIASNGTADCLVLLPTTTDPTRLQDAVYLWDHETGELSCVLNDTASLS